MVNALPSNLGFTLSTDPSKETPVATPLLTSPVAAPQAAPSVGLGQLFQVMLQSVPPEQKEFVAKALQTGAPIVGGAGGATMAAFCGACALGIAGGGMVGKELGNVLGNAAATAIRGPAQ